MDFLPQALQPLASYKQFIIYKIEASETRPGKTDKFPINCLTGKKDNPHDPAIWVDSSTAIAMAKAYGSEYGVGFVFTDNDPYWFLDIDNCIDKMGIASQLAWTLFNLFKGAAGEISSSQKGYHIFGRGRVPAHSCKNKALNIEFYTTERFVALTGIGAVGFIDTDFSNVLPDFINTYFPAKLTGPQSNWTTEAVPQYAGPNDDNLLISLALKSEAANSIFGNAASFRDLWENNTAVLERHYHCDESMYDMALAQRLAFWTGNNCERIQRLMWQSKLVREKWHRDDYIPRTILLACSRQTTWLTYQSKSLASEQSQGNTFLNVEDQVELFKGCTYVCDAHKILIPGGYLLKPDQFRVMYGGYSFVMDTGNTRVSRNAWEAFTESQGYKFPRADSSCFKPNLQPAALVKIDGRQLVNLYWPVETPRLAGDPTPFLNHLAKVCPNSTDQLILLCYMAALVQYKGIKFQWAPLLQGVEGNGKTLFTRCVAFAIGDRYTHLPKANEFTSKFNGWMFAKIFIGVEDIYTADARAEVIEVLKPMITGERLEIEAKGVDKITSDICCNFILNTNHKDGLRKTRNDRRFAPFYTAQQTTADLIRDGLTPEYFINLYNWLRKGGYAIVSELLHTYKIAPEYNPATECQRAPLTSSTEDAISHGLSGIEQEVLEAVEQGITGFKGGWISSVALDKLLEQLRISHRISRNRRRELLQSMGYDWHPALREGRVNNIVMPDGNKPRLYVYKNHDVLRVTDPTEIARLYSEAQSK